MFPLRRICLGLPRTSTTFEFHILHLHITNCTAVILLRTTMNMCCSTITCFYIAHRFNASHCDDVVSYYNERVMHCEALALYCSAMLWFRTTRNLFCVTSMTAAMRECDIYSVERKCKRHQCESMTQTKRACENYFLILHCNNMRLFRITMNVLYSTKNNTLRSGQFVSQYAIR